MPEVLAVDEECLILRWVEPGKATADGAAGFGQALAATHAAGAPVASAREADGFISKLPLPNTPCDTWAEFYAVRRVLPYLKLARDRGRGERRRGGDWSSRSSASSPRCSPRSRRPGCTATSGTATCSGARRARSG